MKRRKARKEMLPLKTSSRPVSYRWDSSPSDYDEVGILTFSLREVDPKDVKVAVHKKNLRYNCVFLWLAMNNLKILFRIGEAVLEKRS